MARTSNRSALARLRTRRVWTRYSNDRLLDLRLRDLGVRLETSWLRGCVERLHDELARRGIRFRPHVWLSTEWFSPDGVPGIAIPFFLAHPRLMALERRQMLEVEGGSEASCMRLLRHETGHAIDTAFRLHFKKPWRATFGSFAARYPDAYRPRPNSRGFVVHLDGWYAQAHPAEDFAETFAVWLTPRSSWRQRYGDWPRALRKLECVDALMREHVVGRAARVGSRKRVDPAEHISQTLRDYYKKKRLHYAGSWPSVFDRDLRRVFSDDRRFAGRPTAASFLRGNRDELRRMVAEWTGVHTYAIDQFLQDVIDRCRELKLRMFRSASRTRTETVLLLTVHTMNSLRVGRYEIPV